MSNEKKLIYYPSLSAGGMKSHFKQNRDILPGLTSRFYSSRFPEPWRHPYFLITAGHHYKDMDFRAKHGMDEPDITVLGDSGGFQVMSGKLELTKELPKQIFDWLNHNADIGVNLDLPPRMNFEGKYDFCLNKSIEHFKYFEAKQDGKCKFLNVIQGNNFQEMENWYSKVKDFEFSGWSVGGGQRLVNLMQTLSIFIRHREFEKTNNTLLHILGVSKISDFLILAYLQEIFNNKYQGRIQVSTDTSSPGQLAVYGYIIHSLQMSKMSFATFSRIKKHGEAEHYPDDVEFPNILGHPVKITLGDIKKYGTNEMAMITMHHVFMFNEAVRQAQELAKMPYDTMEQFINKDFYLVLKSLHEMFDNPDRAYAIYEQYRTVYKRFGGDSIATTQEEILTKFFQ